MVRYALAAFGLVRTRCLKIGLRFGASGLVFGVAWMDIMFRFGDVQDWLSGKGWLKTLHWVWLRKTDLRFGLEDVIIRIQDARA